MSFDVAADAYGRFMGRFSEPLAVLFAEALDLAAGERALDVGCGPGALTQVLVQALGARAVAAADPSESFVAALRTRFPDVDARVAAAEALPFADGAFDVAAAQLVVQFMNDPVVGLREMARVTRPGGRVAASVWDHAGAASPLAVFWRAARELDPTVRDEADRTGAREGQLAQLFAAARLTAIETGRLSVRVEYPSFDAWWEPYTLGVGTAGDHLAGLPSAQRELLRERCRSLLPDGAFAIDASAWSAVGRV